jgi:hypothetical protein
VNTAVADRSSREVKLPLSLEDEEAFALAYDPDTGEYTLSMLNGNTFMLGDYIEAEKYLTRFGLRNSSLQWVEQILPRVTSFFVVQVIPSDQLIIQADIPQSKTEMDILRAQPRVQVYAP